MSAKKRSAGGVIGGFLGFIGMSVIAGLLVTAGVTPAIAVTGLAANDSIGVFEGLPEYLKVEQLAQTSTMYANQGGKPVPIATFYAQDRVEVGWNDIAQVVKDAAISTEDPRFYEHGGIDLIGTVRAIMSNATGKQIQGGSSITQQYVKNVLVQKCEVLNVTLDDPDKQKAADKKYEACYTDATRPDSDRKLKEMKLAIGVEKKFSKDQILRGYLNISGFGGTTYGIQAASTHYFGVSAKDLNLQQAATLVAIVNNPANLRIDQDKTDNPESNAENGFKATLERRNYVIDRMLANKTITKKQHDDAIKTKIEPNVQSKPTGCMAANAVRAGAFCDYVQRIIQADPAFGKDADARSAFFNRGGLSIYTTLNLDLQAKAQDAIRNYVPPTRNGMDVGSASTTVEVGTGRVVTMVQNRDYDNTDKPQPGTTALNYNTDSDYGLSNGFQVGSTWKAFDLVAWLKAGHSLNDVVSGARTSYNQAQFKVGPSCNEPGNFDFGGPWNVSNDSSGENGNYSVMAATAASVNTVFAAMAFKLDICDIRRDAEGLLVHRADGKPLSNSPASVIGTNEIAPITMATAYAGFANNGVACSPVAIDKITDSTGKTLDVPKSQCSTTPIDPKIAAGVIYALQGVLRGGTATAANPNDGVPIYGKTGTTDNSYDNWLIAGTTKVTTAVWLGNAGPVQSTSGAWVKTPLRSITLNGVYGGDVKLRIAKPILSAMNNAYGGGKFPSPTSSVLNARQITVPDLTGKSVQEAQAALEDLGLTYQDGGQADSALPAGQVAGTNPSAGSTVGIGGTVTVATSNGSLKAIPNVVGMKASDAILALSQAGFTSSYSGNPNAIVTASNPGANTAAKPGTSVSLQTQNSQANGGGQGSQGQSGQNGTG
jgi:membrane peptidoglycan carboxypeptidase